MKEQVPALKGIKVAYGQGALLEYVGLLPDVSVFTGNADLFGLVPFGLAGMINPPTSFVPELCVELFMALDGKDYGGAVEAQKRVDNCRPWPRESRYFVIRSSSTARGVSHAWLCREALSEMGNGADAQRRSG